MSTIDLLVAMIERDPDDLFTPGVLTDALQDVRGMTFAEAERHVGLVVQSARDARDLAAAAQVLTDDRAGAGVLDAAIVSAAKVAPGSIWTILAVPGPEAPSARVPTDWDGRMWWGNIVIVVGALWVLRTHRERRMTRDARAAPKRAGRGRK